MKIKESRLRGCRLRSGDRIQALLQHSGERFARRIPQGRSDRHALGIDHIDHRCGQLVRIQAELLDKRLPLIVFVEINQKLHKLSSQVLNSRLGLETLLQNLTGTSAMGRADNQQRHVLGLGKRESLLQTIWPFGDRDDWRGGSRGSIAPRSSAADQHRHHRSGGNCTHHHFLAFPSCSRFAAENQRQRTFRKLNPRLTLAAPNLGDTARQIERVTDAPSYTFAPARGGESAHIPQESPRICSANNSEGDTTAVIGQLQRRSTARYIGPLRRGCRQSSSPLCLAAAPEESGKSPISSPDRRDDHHRTPPQHIGED